MRGKDPFFWFTLSCGAVVVAFIVIPLVELMTSPSISSLWDGLKDKEVVRSIRLSVYTAGSAALISFLFGTPLAYLLARHEFKGKRFLEGVIDLPIVIPHPVVGIAILGVAGRDHWIGQILGELGFRMLGSVTGIITVLTFVGIP
ncbi:MAG: molybdenum ABC transporter permease, partial [Desulfobacterales bacterium]|nr:molybdenum ABC transporter permease [Desulfobacterales bacterium]